MLNEAILKFKGLAPLILPELVNNNQLEEVSMYEDYAILPYSVQKNNSSLFFMSRVTDST